MRLGILGPLLVVDDAGREIRVTSARQRALLAVLLVRANRTVPADELANIVWNGTPPAGAAHTVRSYVMRLRQAVGPTVAARLVTRDPGYLCQVGQDELDALRFEALCQDAGAALRASRWADALDTAEAALTLWRGAPLLDVSSQMLREEAVPGLEQLRMQALEDHSEAALHLGQQDRLVPRLRDLTTRYPLAERFHAQLMVALASAGRQAEALRAYRDARRIVVEELGIEPGPELRSLHDRVLAGDVGFVASTWVDQLSPRAAGGAPVPRQLPAGVGHFTGRQTQLAMLTDVLHDGDCSAGGTVVIAGMAGIGKTTLAVHWAHQVATDFPDGQMFVNLRGFDPAATPVLPADVIRVFLDALGLPADQLPPTEEAQLGLYRSLLVGRRMLIVLDNARDEAQVRPLLPGSPTCRVVVTSRHQLLGLTALEAAHPVTLDLLTDRESRQLLRYRLDDDRVTADPDATAHIVVSCSRLPLALCLVAARATARPDLPLAHIASDLRRRPGLTAFAGSGDPMADIRAVFSWSYRQLDVDTARVFRLAGLHPGPELDLFAVAALAATTLDRAEHILGVLARASLIHPARPGRFGMHDLMRDYAGELTADEDGEQARRAALTRLFDVYLATASAAMDIAFPAERHRRPRIPPPVTPLPSFAGQQPALAWLAEELTGLVAIAGHAAEDGWPRHATWLSDTLFRYLDTAGQAAAARQIHGCALHAARQLDDPGAEANALICLGHVDGQQGRHHEAAEQFTRALALHQDADNVDGQARALNYLGLVRFRQGRPSEAARHLDEAVALFRAVGERTGEAYALSNLGVFSRRQGRHRQATDLQEQALAVFRDIRDRHGEAAVLDRLGLLELSQGHCLRAGELSEQALAIYRELGDRYGEATALARLGMVAHQQTDHDQAGDLLRQALVRYRELSDNSGQAETLNGLGEVLSATRRWPEALAHHTAALELADLGTVRHEQARAHDGLANAYHAISEPQEARRHWQQALDIYTDLGVPEADQVRDRLHRHT